MRPIARIAALALALALVPLAGAQADEIGGSGFAVPAPAPPQPVSAPPPPYVELESRQVAAGIGIRWGSGTLSFDGRQHAFTVKGLSLVDVGVARMIAEGEVENLERLADFAGRYVAVEAGATLGKGAARTVLRNEHGVVIRLSGETTGAALTLGAAGFQIALR